MKTCGECKWYDYHHLLCIVGGEVTPSDCACDSFIPIKPTTGNKIRQMSDEELSDLLVYPVTLININGTIYYEFTSCLLLGKSYPMREQAVFITKQRLNAPAENEEARRMMSKNKICGGCYYFDKEIGHCERFECGTRKHYIACDGFKSIEDEEAKDE